MATEQTELFELLPRPPRKKREHLMRMIDAGINPFKGHPHIAQFRCKRCGHESEWLAFATITEIKRGIRCPQCNDDKRTPFDPKAALLADLERQGYFELRECLRTGKLYGLYRFAFTIGLCCDLQEHHYEYRYCYHGLDDAIPALRDWQARGFQGEPVGYIKRK